MHDVSVEDAQAERGPEQKSIRVDVRLRVVSSVRFNEPMSGMVPVSRVVEARSCFSLALDVKKEVGSSPVR